MLLEKKNYKTYLETLSLYRNLRDSLYRDHNIVLGYVMLLIDFKLVTPILSLLFYYENQLHILYKKTLLY